MYCDHFLQNEKKYRYRQLRQAIFKELVSSFSEITVFPQALREHLSENIPFNCYKKSISQISSDKKTNKALLHLADDNCIETVLMRHPDRNTICVSSQVGCPAGCSFCSTGAQGFTRNLSEREIVEQILFWARLLKQEYQKKHQQKWNLENTPSDYHISNIVFMGMGEPLLNFDNVSAAIQTITDPEGLGLSHRHISISTVGIIPNILKLLELPRTPRLAISLHATSDELRSRIVPMNQKYPLAKLLATLDLYTAQSKQRIFYEYVLLKNINDSPEQIDQLGRLLQNKPAHLNFIPWNPGPSREKFRRPDLKQIKLMKKQLEDKYGLSVSIRATYGDRIAAACGQLARKTNQA